ncbi:methyl-accepting chemotaxis protein [Saccharospirillum salsuginis]|uniref:Methyl-accepting chemotaxis protein n=1 Tax=Saccharospirillum salsuginis TaxID=418750 RepID=A0A918KST2_9GAMM|nr:methyl-accepting chemotaxis protein [Saccharospirillum salsuginis]GGX74710.1 hypothetical protein GCM10007392_47490 [Saccharospirillum salsuginis]
MTARFQRAYLRGIGARVAGLILVVALVIAGVFVYTQSGMRRANEQFNQLVQRVNESGDLLEQLSANFLSTSNGASALLSAGDLASVDETLSAIQALTPRFESAAQQLVRVLPETRQDVDGLLAERQRLDRVVADIAGLQRQMIERRNNNQAAIEAYRADSAELIEGLSSLIQLINMFASDYPIVIEAQNVKQDLLSLELSLINYMSVQDLGELKSLRVDIEDLMQSGLSTFETLRLMVEDPTTEGDILELYQGYQALLEQRINEPRLFDTRVEQLEARNQALGRVSEVEASIDALGSSIDAFKARTRTLIEQSRAQTDSIVDQVLQAMAVAIVIVILSFAGLVWMVRSVVVKPVQAITQRVVDIAEGEGDLTRRIVSRRTDELGTLANQFNAFIEKIQGMIVHIRQASEQLGEQSRALSHSAHTTKDYSDQQRRDTDRLAEDMDTLAASVDEVAQQAQHSANQALEAIQTGRNTHAQVGETIAAFEKLAADVGQGAGLIESLAEDIEQVDSVLDVINGIAEQTNLLALNAAIEAARAGEQGRGFAVVAEEVRALASRTQQSTSDIQHVVEQVQAGSAKATTFMKSSQDNSDAALEKARGARQQLTLMVEVIEQVERMNQEIGEAAKGQQAITAQVSERTRTVAQTGQQTDQEAQRSAEYCERMDELSESLNRLVGRFKVAEDEHSDLNPGD